MTIGQKIQALRRQKGWSQEMLADQLSVSRQSLSKWELDISVPDASNLRKLSKLFAVSVDCLLDDEAGVPENTPPQNAVKSVTERFKLSGRAKRLIAENGHIACYFLIGRDLLALLVVGLICFAYLTALPVPLQMFPTQAFIMPIAAGVIGIFFIARIVIFLFLAVKLKRTRDHD